MAFVYIFLGLIVIGLFALLLNNRLKSIRYLRRFKQAYNNDIVILDTETTGLDVYNDDIVQIAAVRVKSGKEIGQFFNIFVESSKQIPTMLGKMPNPLIEVYNSSDCNKMSKEEGLRFFMEFVKESPILGHNIEFDYNMLLNNIKRISDMDTIKPWSPIRFDTIRLAKILYPSLHSYSLSSLKEALHLTIDLDSTKPAHLADVDVQLTKALAILCANKIGVMNSKNN